MSNTFSFNRFGKLLATDGKKYLHNFGIALIILCSLNIGNWLLSLVFGIGMPAIWRWFVIYVAVSLSIILVPAKAFGDINLPREGVSYALLPVSNLERYLSYLLYCLLTPVFVLFFSWGLDSLLTLIPIGGFDNYIRTLSFTTLMTDFLLNGGVVDITVNGATGLEPLNDLMDRVKSMEGWNNLVSLLFYLGVFMLGNLLFKSHKTGKTFGIMLAITYAMSMIVEIFLFARGIFPWIRENAMNPTPDFEPFTDFIGTSMTVSMIIYALLTAALYVGTYFKLKNQKY